MHVKHAQKDADARPRLPINLNYRNVGHLTVGRRHDRSLNGRNPPLGIAKKPQKKRGQQHWNNHQRRYGQPANQRGYQKQCQTVVDAVTNHERLLIIEPLGPAIRYFEEPTISCASWSILCCTSWNFSPVEGPVKPARIARTCPERSMKIDVGYAPKPSSCGRVLAICPASVVPDNNSGNVNPNFAR